MVLFVDFLAFDDFVEDKDDDYLVVYALLVEDVHESVDDIFHDVFIFKNYFFNGDHLVDEYEDVMFFKVYLYE